MPFKSQAQRRLFYAKNKTGEISDADLSKWIDETPKGKKLPERLTKKAFWVGFGKEAIEGGGKGFGSVGKATNSNPIGQLERDKEEGSQESHGRAEGEDTRTQKGLLDRDRTARDFMITKQGPEFQVDSVPIKY
jgi:hypothetical protein